MKVRALLFNATAVAALGVAPFVGATGASAEENAAAANIVRAPTELPSPIGERGPETVQVDLETVEVVGNLADGTTYRYWTFNNKVPGPFVRVRVGDTVEVTLKNNEDSWMPHNVDFHAVTGLHGGGHATMADPGEQSDGFRFKALKAGLTSIIAPRRWSHSTSRTGCMGSFLWSRRAA